MMMLGHAHTAPPFPRTSPVHALGTQRQALACDEERRPVRRICAEQMSRSACMTLGGSIRERTSRLPRYAGKIDVVIPPMVHCVGKRLLKSIDSLSSLTVNALR